MSNGRTGWSIWDSKRSVWDSKIRGASKKTDVRELAVIFLGLFRCEQKINEFRPARKVNAIPK